MLHKTKGIVLAVNKYSDRYSITRVFTRDFGMVSYSLPLSNSKKSKIKRSIFFPFSVIDMEVQHKASNDIQRLNEVTRSYPLIDIPSNITKTLQSFFLAEFLSKILQESENNQSIFLFIEQSIQRLENQKKTTANFHIAFMLLFSQHMGLLPDWHTFSQNSHFDMASGIFVSKHLPTNYCLTTTQSLNLFQLRRMNYDNMHCFKLSRDNRNTILDYMLDYYRLHLYNFPTIKSLEVLRDL